MPPVLSRKSLLAEVDAEHARLAALIERVPPGAWTSSPVNSAGWTLKDVLAHLADWAERCAGWCTLGGALDAMTPPAPGFKWTETRELNHQIYLKRRGHTLSRVLKDYQAAHAALRTLAANASEADLLAVGRFGWCGKSWSMAKHIRANTAAHDRWAAKHFQRALRAIEADAPAPAAPTRTSAPSRRARAANRTRRGKKERRGES